MLVKTYHSEFYDSEFTQADWDIAVQFAQNFARMSGKTLDMDLSEPTGEEIDQVIAYATEMGFDAYRAEGSELFEKAVLDANVNDGNPKIFTSFFRNHKKLSQYGVQMVKVSIGSPGFLKKDKYKSYLNLAPTREMLNALKKGIMELDEFRTKYDEILNQLDAKTVVDELLGMGEGKDVVILCFEKLPYSCHRHRVGKWLKTEIDYNATEFPYLS